MAGRTRNAKLLNLGVGRKPPNPRITSEQRARNLERTKAWRRRYPEKVKAILKRYREKVYAQHGGKTRMPTYPVIGRRTALEACGGRCWRCGIADLRILQFDHIHGNGNAHRRQARWMNGPSSYRRVLGLVWEGQLQVLCANCNWIKRAEQREHTRRRELGIGVCGEVG